MADLKRACWDCEAPIARGALCVSCDDHRRDCLEPVHHVQQVLDDEGYAWRLNPRQNPPIVVFTSRPQIRLEGAVPVLDQWWCHGAGPNGLDESRLGMTPRPLFTEWKPEPPTRKSRALV